MKRFGFVSVLVCACLVLSGCGTAVPDVRGKSLADARTVIADAGFLLGTVAYDPASTSATGSVTAQSPEAGGTAKAGSSVSVTLAGQPPVKTPKVVGLDAKQAESALAAVGLQLGATTDRYDATAAAGVIVSQSPSDGADADRGSSIAVVLSKGPEPVPVPAVSGKSEADAATVLKAAGFVVAVSAKADKAPKGTVLAQTPASGEAQPGTTVTLIVSSGIEMVKVPSWKSFPGSYNGDDWDKVLASAKAAIQSGFKKRGLVAVVEFVNGYSDPNGSQSPKAGAMVPRGTRVSIEVPVFD